MHIASFAGIAPVNNPVISVAVVMDDPKGASYYGTAVSAPVFAEVAQQVLEYLGVSHDIDVHAPRPGKDKAPSMIVEDDREENTGDINALFAAVNDLPSDDPLRAVANQPAASAQPNPQAASQTVSKTTNSTAGNNAGSTAQTASSAAQQPKATSQQTTAVTVVEARRLQVPSLLGLSVRKVIEQAATAGLAVQITGNGTVREQAPTAGTMVTPGTQIVVRCGR
jgi:cell division protein FtsI (penicillin-binding protein 3)